MEHYKEIIEMIEKIQKAELEKSLNAFEVKDFFESIGMETEYITKGVLYLF